MRKHAYFQESPNSCFSVCRFVLKAHFGPVVIGEMKWGNLAHLDVYGETVNIAATLESFGFSITPQAFRQLSFDQRKVFKKHTPPIRYIPTDEQHND